MEKFQYRHRGLFKVLVLKIEGYNYTNIHRHGKNQAVIFINKKSDVVSLINKGRYICKF